MNRMLRTLALILLVVMLAACGSQPPAQPTTPDTGAATPPATTPPADDAPAVDADWPREFTDAFGETVIIEKKPERVISLSLGLDEVVMALAGPSRFAAISDIARSEYSNIVALANEVPETVRNDLEQILGFEPDLLLLDGFAQPELVLQARSAGLTIIVTDLHDTFAEHLENVAFLARVLGEEARGKELVAELTARADALAAIVAEAGAGQDAPRVLHVTPNLFIPGLETTTEDIIIRAGAVNAASEAGVVGWQQLSLESVAEMAPDVIIHDEFDADNLRNEILEHPSLADVPAIRDGRVYEIPSRYLSTLSFWNLRGAEELATYLWPEATASAVFADFD